MKMTEELKKATTNMKPGVLTAEGFLGNDHRDLATIIQHDEELMQKVGLDWAAVGAKLREILRSGEDGLGESITVQGKWLVKTDDTRGTIPSPWEDGIYHKMTAEVEKLSGGKPSGKKIVFNELCIHLLEKHHFLQGKGSPFRLEPETLKEVLA